MRVAGVAVRTPVVRPLRPALKSHRVSGYRAIVAGRPPDVERLPMERRAARDPGRPIFNNALWASGEGMTWQRLQRKLRTRACAHRAT